MLKPHENGSLTATLPLHTKLCYELSNRVVLAQADGSFSLSRYAVAGLFPVFQEDSFYTTLWINGIAIPWGTEKQVEMLGRMQAVRLETDKLSLESLTFLDESTEAIFQQYTLVNKTNTALAAGADFGYLFDAGLWAAANTQRAFGAGAGAKMLEETNGFAHSLPGGQQYTLACCAPLTLREVEGRGVHYSWGVQLQPGGKQVVQLVYKLHVGQQAPAAALLHTFAPALSQARQYQASLQSTLCGGTPLERALYASALNCALSSYKQTSGFQGFYAGIHYQSPPRTYYRDGYFTVLPVLAHQPGLVREEILTLALGIEPDGTCPSAVIDADQVFWPQHLDSPAFFILMLHDYLAATRDFPLLEVEVKGKTILSHTLALADAMLAQADENHLLYRQPGNRHDWADNIYREGYVTYIQALFYRAIHCTGRVLHAAGQPGAQQYGAAAQQIQNAINTLLWNEEKGWYNNYSSPRCTEDNLSIDTVFCVVFGVADVARSKRLLANMEQMLESQNNKEQPFGDWGTLCCWPPYQYPAHLVEKSSYPFVYHNGSDWPYWSALYAFAKSMHGMPCTYPLTRWFIYGLEKGWATPVEYYGPVAGRGSLLQAWSAMAAFTLRFAGQSTFPFAL